MEKKIIPIGDWASTDAPLSARPPVLIYYKAKSKKTNATVLIFPGGGYYKLSTHEGEGYAEFFGELGMDTFVLDYRIAPDRFPAPLVDARYAIKYIRKNASALGIDRNKVAVMGSSAGGHLAALVCTYRASCGEGDMELCDYLPNAQILCYPVTDRRSHDGSYNSLLGDEVEALEKSATPTLIADENTPPVFIWHTSSDPAVNIEGTYSYLQRLHQLGVACEMHAFPVGDHGLGLANDGGRNLPYVARWSGLLIEWLILNGYLPNSK